MNVDSQHEPEIIDHVSNTEKIEMLEKAIRTLKEDIEFKQKKALDMDNVTNDYF